MFGYKLKKETKTEAQIEAELKAERKAKAKAQIASAASATVDILEASLLAPAFLTGMMVKGLTSAYKKGAK